LMACWMFCPGRIVTPRQGAATALDLVNVWGFAARPPAAPSGRGIKKTALSDATAMMPARHRVRSRLDTVTHLLTIGPSYPPSSTSSSVSHNVRAPRDVLGCCRRPLEPVVSPEGGESAQCSPGEDRRAEQLPRLAPCSTTSTTDRQWADCRARLGRLPDSERAGLHDACALQHRKYDD
jgi:hypothetical protein